MLAVETTPETVRPPDLSAQVLTHRAISGCPRRWTPWRNRHRREFIRQRTGVTEPSTKKSAPTPALPRKRKPARRRPPGHQALGVGSDELDHFAANPLEEIGLAVGRDDCQPADILPGRGLQVLRVELQA